MDTAISSGKLPNVPLVNHWSTAYVCLYSQQLPRLLGNWASRTCLTPPPELPFTSDRVLQLRNTLGYSTCGGKFLLLLSHNVPFVPSPASPTRTIVCRSRSSFAILIYGSSRTSSNLTSWAARPVGVPRLAPFHNGTDSSVARKGYLHKKASRCRLLPVLRCISYSQGLSGI